jgi:outer membrane protein, heavy metal efflux system
MTMSVRSNDHWRQRGALAAIVAAVVAATPARAPAQDGQDVHVAHVEPSAHVHVPLVVDGELDWQTLIDTALAAHPQSGELVARAAEADAWQRRGKQWLAAAPSLYFSYLSDRSLDDFGQRQYDSGVELPLWRAGQRGAVQTVAASATAGSAAAAAALRLEISGLLRGVLWDVESAANGLDSARDAVTVAQELVRTVERRNERGDLPRADALLARATLLERRQKAVEAEAQLRDAERSYRSLTGLDARPAVFAERAAELDELEPSHPLIALADAAIARADADKALAERDVRGAMLLTIGPHREYDPGGTVPRDSVTVGFKVPVGGKAHGVTQTAHASRLIAAALAEKGQLMRRLDLDLHEAEHTLSVLEESIELAAERDALAVEQLAMAQSAFAQGEIELRELLRIQESTLAARRDLERLRIERERTVAARNQALGVTP